MKRLLRKSKARLLRFKKSAPAVLVFGVRRGGSTMVSDAISANKGVWFADEPYAMFPKRNGFAEKSARLFIPQHSHFFDLSEDEERQFASFSHDLLAAQFRTMGTARHTKSMLRADRICLKVLNAPWMLPWFSEKTDSFIIAVTRHPGAQARSVLRQNWGFPVEAYLARPALLETTFTAEQVAFAHDVFGSGDRWKTAVLDWVITSHPLRHAIGPKVIKTRYETIVSDPSKFIMDVLEKTCGLSDRDAMEHAILKPSGSSHLNTSAATQSITARDTDKMLNGWRHGCSDDEMKSGQDILDRFGITDYRFVD